ncbi:MAG: beta-N-acetylhexosaminidase [Xanthomonadales bacterium]|nr:beta-N-acetylhexosaminidase [Xanthomonadales bacterium]
MSLLMIGLPGPTLDADSRRWLSAPQVVGAILFARNIESREQLEAFNAEMRRFRPELLLAVDQEGGRVRRLREGWLPLPPLADLGALWARDPSLARRAVRLHAELMALEVRASGFDLSFAPVADVAGGNACIGDRALHADPEIAARLVALYVARQQACGMAATLKHFPGHGAVSADSHHDLATDDRPWEAIVADLLPFAAGIEAGARAVMMAHVAVPAVDPQIAGASARWIGLLRQQLGFRGAIVSDDLAMLGAAAVGELPERLQAHAQAGCDLLLACDPQQVDEALRLTDALPRPARWPLAIRRLRASQRPLPPPAADLQDRWNRLQELLTDE